MPPQEKQKKRQKILLIILGVVIVIAIFALYNSQKKSAEQEYQIKETTPPGISVEEKKLKEIKLNLEILDSELFQALKSHGVLPVVPGETGRSNPFQPPL